MSYLTLDTNKRIPTTDNFRRPHPANHFAEENDLSRYTAGGDVTLKLRRIYEMNRRADHPTSILKELSKVKRLPLGALDQVLVTHIVDPHNFFVVMKEEAGYCLDHPGWTRYFKPFRNGLQAAREIPNLLAAYFNLSPSLTRSFGIGGGESVIRFEQGDLVTVKVKLRNSETDSRQPVKSSSCEFRRGMVVGSIPGSEQFRIVYLIDIGMQAAIPLSSLLPLPKPFNFIAPLAIKACLFGISPAGENWVVEDTQIFEKSVREIQNKASVMSIEIQSLNQPPHPKIMYEDYPIHVKMEARKLIIASSTRKQVFKVDFAQQLINKGRCLVWNLFPNRPKLMECSYLQRNDGSYPGINLDEGILLTPYNTRAYAMLPLEVQKREVEKLLRLRRSSVVDIMGMDNRLIAVIREDNREKLEAYQTPCRIIAPVTEDEEEA